MQLLSHERAHCKKIGDEELKRIQTERTIEKKFIFVQDYSRKRGPIHGSEQLTRGQDFQRRNPNNTNVEYVGIPHSLSEFPFQVKL